MNSKQEQLASRSAMGSKYEIVRKFTVVKAGVFLSNVKEGKGAEHMHKGVVIFRDHEL